MAVNHADGTMFVSIVFYPIAAGLAATAARAGWFSFIFVIASVPFGALVIYLGRKFIYWMTENVLKRVPEDISTLASWFVVGPFFLAYLILPFAFIGAGVFGTWFGTIWVVKHIL